MLFHNTHLNALPGGYENKEVKVPFEDVQEEVSEEVDVQEDVTI